MTTRQLASLKRKLEESEKEKRQMKEDHAMKMRRVKKEKNEAMKAAKALIRAVETLGSECRQTAAQSAELHEVATRVHERNTLIHSMNSGLITALKKEDELFRNAMRLADYFKTHMNNYKDMNDRLLTFAQEQAVMLRRAVGLAEGGIASSTSTGGDTPST